MTPEIELAPLSPVKQALLEIRRLRARVEEFEAAETKRNEPIAIVGMAVRMPGGILTLDDFWKALDEGRDCVSEVPPERWNMDEFYAPDPMAAGKISSRYGAFLKDVDQFDAEFFGISPRESEKMDPQHRLLLEVAWEALEDAGVAPPDIAGTKAGVFIGLANSDYGRMLLSDAETMDPHSVVGGALSIAAGRLSYFFNLRGPSMVIDTACSSSLVAMHLACNGLRAGETDLAIVGGANLTLLPEGSVGFSRTRMLAADGRCKTFDANADGYVRGEGCAAVILMRLSDAQRNVHPVHALYRGSAVNQDGRSAGLTAPNGPSQEIVLRAALDAAGIAPSAVSYVECHGTGTALGDPIEVQALAAVYGEGRERSEPLHIGSVKANIGHLEAAAGVAGLIKAVLSLQHSILPPQINLTGLNPLIAWDNLPVSVVRSKIGWQRGREPRIAGVSSFGFSGTNAHVLIEEAPLFSRGRENAEDSAQVFCISAKTTAALKDLVTRYEAWLADTSPSLGDVCFTANAGRAHHRERLSFIAGNTSELKMQLRLWLEGKMDAKPFQSNKDAWDLAMQQVQQEYLSGDKINWRAIYKDKNYRRISLPNYPFQPKSYWITPLAQTSNSTNKPELDAVFPGVASNPLPEPSMLATALALPPQMRYEWMFSFVTTCIRESLRLEPGFELAPRDRLTELGMDSLIALELRSTISRELSLGDRISSTIAFDAGTVEELIRIVMEATFPAIVSTRLEAAGEIAFEPRRLTVDEVSELSEEQVEQLVAASIGQLSQRSGRG